MGSNHENGEKKKRTPVYQVSELDTENIYDFKMVFTKLANFDLDKNENIVKWLYI